MGFGTLIQRITYKISGRSAASSGLYTPSTYVYDYAVGGTPFMSATADQRPDTEKPVGQRKQQFDNFKDPGEYSLDQWWLRSQNSFTGGAGVLYQDPDTAGVSSGTSVNIRYNRSVGVDPFSSPGFLKLLPEMNKSAAYSPLTAGSRIRAASYISGSLGVSKLWLADMNNAVVTSATVGTSDVSINYSTTLGATGIFSNLVTYHAATQIAAVNYPTLYVMTAGTTAGSSGLWKITDNGGALTATLIYVSPVSFAFAARAEMVNSRGFIYVAVNNSLWQLDPNAGAATAWPATPVATVPADQSITCVVDGPDAVYVSANNFDSGYIYKSTFSNTGVVNGLTQAAIMPKGEFINQMAAYVATYMVISTNTTIRVGGFASGGIDYGSPLVTVPAEADSPTEPTGLGGVGFGSIAFFGSKAFVGTQTISSLHDGAQGTICIDLSTILTDQNTGSVFNPYSTWTYNPAIIGRIDSVTVDPLGRLIYSSMDDTIPGSPVSSLWIQHASNLISLGYLDTGRVRFNTVEPKLFKYFSVRTPIPLQGDLTVSVLGDDNSLTNYITYGPTMDPGTTDVSTPTPVGPRNYEALRFTLHRGSTDPSIGAVLDSWQIKALPGTLKQRTIVKQFLCFNSEKDKSGSYVKADDQSLTQLTAIRQMCQRGDTVTFQDLVNNISDQVIIDDYQFTMLAPPGPNRENYGGYLTVTMRTVADSVPPISQAGSSSGDD